MGVHLATSYAKFKRMKRLLIIIAFIPNIICSQTLEFDTTCFCSEIIVKANKQGFYIVETMPIYPGGGNDSFKKFFENNTNFQKIDNGKILVYFTINCEGNTCGHNAEVTEGNISDVSQQNVLLSLNKMQKWKPGKQRNNVVDVRYSRVFEIINGMIE